jgi:ABC-2 type transport system ATP-binding protein
MLSGMAAIELNGLTKRFGEVAALTDVSFSIEAGEVFGYLGPNGAGKTTTIRCLLGLMSPTSGSARMFGTDVATGMPGLLARVGYLPGEFGLWPTMTGDEALAYLGSLHPAPPVAREALCDRFELSARDRARPVRAYSRGMRQKIGLVQAFQHRPDLVILDEPTEGLDPVMQQRFIDLIAEHRADGGTTLMSSHILSEVERACTRVAIVRDGRLVRLGTPGDLVGSGARRCVVRATGAGAALAGIPGVAEMHTDEHTTRFTFTGDINALLRVVATLEVEEFTIESEGLSDAFFEVFDA